MLVLVGNVVYLCFIRFTGFRKVYCPNCGESGHHVDFPQLCNTATATTTATGTSTSGEASERKKKRKKQKDSQAADLGVPCCMEPKYEAFTKYPQCTYYLL